jgi:hypothetical protein
MATRETLILDMPASRGLEGINTVTCEDHVRVERTGAKVYEVLATQNVF